MQNETNSSAVKKIPLLALRGMTVFPGMMLNFDVERSISIAALNAALSADQYILLAAQKDIAQDIPFEKDIYMVGTVCRIKQLVRMPGSKTVRVMVEGLQRARIVSYVSETPYFSVAAESVADDMRGYSAVKAQALLRRVRALFDEWMQLSGSQSPDLMLSILGSEDAAYVSDFVAQNVFLRHEQKQELLEQFKPVVRLRMLVDMLEEENEVLTMEQSLQDATREQIGRGQREYFLREQMRLIQSELGEGEETDSDIAEYREKIVKAELTEEVRAKLEKEVTRLAKQPFGSSESSVIRNYLDVCLELPWGKKTEEILDVEKARRQLDDDHFGLEKIKQRILEYLAVRQLTPEVRGGVLCLVGPPGTGKTSIAISIAKATNRKLARIALGGVHDEAEIRGHRKTYVGAMPGRIIAGIQQAESANPLLLLDEIDKLGSDYRGDPSAALLEALDFEQNHSFRDHYLELPFDLSDCMFITTANTTETIPAALLDRMEIIELSSYTDEEKLQIAKRHLLPKQRKKHGLNGNQLRVSDAAIREIIAQYTRESGVRVLERELGALCRKAASAIATQGKKCVSVKAGELEPYLGVARYKPEQLRGTDEVGLVNGLAWTSVGGEMLNVEVAVVEGSGKLELTGNLGDVMKESAQAAVTYIRSRCTKLGIAPDFYKTKDIHIHFPEGAVPKDGPSAGITICVGVISALTGAPVRRDIAMTGEITLRGRILAIGGLKEKTMAALRNGIHTIILPKDNERDLEEIDQTVRRALNFIPAEHVDQILDIALDRTELHTELRNAELGAEQALVPNVGESRPAVQLRQ